jgi:cytochrome c553
MKRPALIVIGVLGLSALEALHAVPATAATPKAAAKSAPMSPHATCDVCHGVNGGEGNASVHSPRIAGQSAEYLQKQLDDFASGTRESPIMSSLAKALSEDQRQELAQHYASLSTPYLPEQAPSAQQLDRGHQLAYLGDDTKRVQACNSCHGPDGIGVLHAAPYLAGQSSDYIASAFKAFKSGTRKNDAGELMRSVAMRLDDTDVAAVAAYFASQGAATH